MYKSYKLSSLFNFIIFKASYNKSRLFDLLRPEIFLIAGIFLMVHVQFFMKILPKNDATAF